MPGFSPGFLYREEGFLDRSLPRRLDVPDGDGLTYQGRLKHFSPDASSIRPSKHDNVAKLPGILYSPADVANPTFWAVNINKYRRATPSEDAKFKLLRHTDRIRSVLKMLFPTMVWHIPEPSEEDILEISRDCMQAGKGSAGIGWQDGYRNKSAVFKQYGLVNFLRAALNGAFNDTLVFNKSCSKDELRSMTAHLTKNPRGFIPTQVHVYCSSALVFKPTAKPLRDCHATMIGFSPFRRGMHNLFVELTERRKAAGLPDNWISADLKGNDQGQQQFVRMIYYGNFTFAPIIRGMAEWILLTFGGSFIVAQNGDVFFKINGFDTGTQQTLDINTVNEMILFIWCLIEKGVTLYNIAEWPFKVMGDDLLACWPESFGNFYVFANDLVTPATTLEYTNENREDDGEPVLWSPLAESQILSYGFKEVDGLMMPYPWRVNKLLTRLDYETDNENPLEVAITIFVQLYFHEEGKKIVADHIVNRWGPIALQKATMRAMSMHYGYQCGGLLCGSYRDFGAVQVQYPSGRTAAVPALVTNCHNYLMRDMGLQVGAQVEQEHWAQYERSGHVDQQLVRNYSAVSTDMFHIDAIMSRDYAVAEKKHFQLWRRAAKHKLIYDERSQLQSRPALPVHYDSWWLMLFHYILLVICGPLIYSLCLFDAQGFRTYSCSWRVEDNDYMCRAWTRRHYTRRNYDQAYLHGGPNSVLLNAMIDAENDYERARLTAANNVINHCLHHVVIRRVEANVVFTGGWKGYKNVMSTPKTRASASGPAAKIVQNSQQKKTSKKVQKQAAPKAAAKKKSAPKMSIPRAVQTIKAAISPAEITKQVKLLKATIQPIDYDGLAHLPTQDANNLAHYHQRTRNVFEPNADGKLKFVMTNWPDARVLANLDTPPPLLTHLVSESEFKFAGKPKKSKQFAYRIYPEHMKWWRNFKRDFWQNSNDPLYKQHMLAMMQKFKQKRVNANGHRVALPGPMTIQPSCTYLIPTLTTTSTIADSWFYNAGSLINGGIAFSAEKPLNGVAVNHNGETEVRAISTDHHGSTDFRLVKPIVTASPVPFTGAQVPILMSIPRGEVPDGIYGMITRTSGSVVVKLYACDDYVTQSGGTTPRGTLAASSGTISASGGFALAWTPGNTMAGGQQVNFICTLTASTTDLWVTAFSLTVPQINYTPDPSPSSHWYALSTIDSELIIDSSQSLRTIGSEAKISNFSAPIEKSGEITQAILPADFFVNNTLVDVTDDLVNQITDSRNAAAADGGRTYLPNFSGQPEFVSEEDVDASDDGALIQPSIVMTMSGLSPDNSVRLETGIHLEGPSTSQLFVNRAFPPDIAAQQRVAGAVACIPHHNCNPLGGVALAIAEGAFIAAIKRYPLVEEVGAFCAYFKKLYDTAFVTEAAKLAK